MARPPALVRLGLLLLGLVSAEAGIWAAFFPRSFYDSFPGGGHHWVAVDGPYNQHLVRDFGQFNLAFAILFATVAFTSERRSRQAVLVAYAVAEALHLTYHAAHLGVLRTTDAVANMVTLGLAVAVPIALLLGEPWLARRNTT